MSLAPTQTSIVKRPVTKVIINFKLVLIAGPKSQLFPDVGKGRNTWHRKRIEKRWARLPNTSPVPSIMLAA